MNIKQILTASLIALISLSIFYSCDKIEEGEYFKPVATDRFVLTEFIVDAQDIDETEYNEYVTFAKTNNFITPIVVLSGDTSIQGNSLASNEILSLFALNTTSNSVMINRVQQNSNYGIIKDERTALLNTELEKDGNFIIEMESEYIDSTNLFESSYLVKSLNSYNEPIELSVFIIEDSIVVNGFIVDNVLNSIDYNLKSASSLSRGEETFKGDYQKDLSNYNEASKVKLVFVLANSNTNEVLQVSTIKIESGDNSGNQNLTFSNERNAFIEDFTGHQCTFCPKAHRELARLQGILGSRVVGMAIHFGFQADLEEFDGFVVDYKTEVGTAIGDFFASQSDPLPFGFVNRISENGNWIRQWAEWNTMISDIIAQEAQIGIAIDAKIENGSVIANISTKAFTQVDSQIKIQGFITESKLESKQKDSESETGIIENYKQNHVLRGSINGTWGEDLTTAPYPQDLIVNKTYNYNLDSDWNTENLSLIVIVYDDITKEVLQVEEKHL